MDRKTNITRLVEAIKSGKHNEIAHAIIYFEKEDPTIAISMSTAIAEAWAEASKDESVIWGNQCYSVEYAEDRRRERLGDLLWYGSEALIKRAISINTADE